MPRTLFRSSPRPVARPSSVKSAARFLIVAGALGVGAYFFLPGIFRPNEDLRQRFLRHRTDFAALKDMIAAESSIGSVGVDNVGDFWLFDGQWTASGRRFLIYTKSEMLESSGISTERYSAYLEHLSRVGAYRVARQNPAGQGLRGTVFLFNLDSTDDPAQNIIFSARPPEPLLSWTAARRSSRTAYAKIEDGWYAEFQRS